MNSNTVNTSIENSNGMQPVPAFQGFLASKSQTLVNARDLHQFLNVGRDFSNWIKKRISEYQFIENQDFIVFAQFGENLQVGRPNKDYHISLDMAKELSMVERTERGRQARQYFISMEQKAITSHNSLAELNSRLKDGIFSHNLRYRQMYRYLQKELTHEEIARCMQISTRMVRNLYREMQDLELLPSQEIFVLAHTGRISRLASPKQLGLEV
ncbi:antA/AntB antirepressor family protein [Acinetobacter johnsonii]|uniref:antA/AntB antirepressor family protein n=1 Tax=Acinetobacter johnsonii TaxID=40214 RepID=UPI00191A45CF|nr:antA/AntB antirepressor family protein [Acinetobacter johnsonii]QQT94630.1 antA/AntB antirepressor family protein [Acinetobacter johnsonii]